MHALRLLAVVAAALLGGCATAGYYAQAVGGQLEILARSRPIADLLDGRSEPHDFVAVVPEPLAPAKRARLEQVLRIRAFAVEALSLPDSGSYTTYADLQRPVVAWNVVATPEFSLAPKEWCYPFAGCAPYRGYFSQARAEREAEALRRDHLDVRVAAVAAYSTLGWFRDPVLDSQLRLDDADLVALVFHELAHQEVYVAGDAAFNESFATTVETEGVRRWLIAAGDPAMLAAWRRASAHRREFIELVRRYRVRLAELYAATLDDDVKRSAKRRLFAELRDDYRQLKSGWGGDRRYDGWLAPDLNNAHLAGLGLYHDLVPEFQRLLAARGGDLPAFYRAVHDLARLPAAERRARLAAADAPPGTAP